MTKADASNATTALHEWVRRFETGPVAAANDAAAPLIFVIDIYRSPGENRFFPKVHRRETFVFRPSFSPDWMKECDQEVMVVDESQAWDDISAGSWQEALEKTLRTLEEQLSVTFRRP